MDFLMKGYFFNVVAKATWKGGCFCLRKKDKVSWWLMGEVHSLTMGYTHLIAATFNFQSGSCPWVGGRLRIDRVEARRCRWRGDIRDHPKHETLSQERPGDWNRQERVSLVSLQWHPDSEGPAFPFPVCKDKGVKEAGHLRLGGRAVGRVIFLGRGSR